MSKIRFMWDNLVDVATLTPSSEVASLPAKNIQHPHRKLVWRTNTDNLEWVELNLGSAQSVKAVALINHNFYDDVNLKMRLLGSKFVFIGGTGYGGYCKGFWDWMFKDGTDRSVAGMHLTPHGSTGTPTISWNGDTNMFGFKCHFDRLDSQYWDHPNHAALNVGDGDFTLMGWVKSDYKFACQPIMDKRQITPSVLGYHFQIFGSAGTTSRLGLKLDSTSGSAEIYGNTTTVANNNWRQIAVVVDRTVNQARFYLDGSPDSDWQDISGIGSATLSNDVTFQIGCNLDHNMFFDGYMGIMQLIKKKLSDAQISDAANGPAVIEDLTYDDEIIIKCFTGSSKQYWRFECDNSANPDNYIDIGRVFLGDYFEPSRQFARGWEELLIDPSRVEQSEQGQEWVDLKEKHRLVRVEFPEGAPLSEADRESYREMLQAVGCSKDLFIALDYDNQPSKLSLYGKFAQTEFNFREFLAGLFSTGFDFKESR